jgi:hypothetical protein
MQNHSFSPWTRGRRGGRRASNLFVFFVVSSQNQYPGDERHCLFRCYHTFTAICFWEEEQEYFTRVLLLFDALFYAVAGVVRAAGPARFGAELPVHNQTDSSDILGLWGNKRRTWSTREGTMDLVDGLGSTLRWSFHFHSFEGGEKGEICLLLVFGNALKAGLAHCIAEWKTQFVNHSLYILLSRSLSQSHDWVSIPTIP